MYWGRKVALGLQFVPGPGVVLVLALGAGCSIPLFSDQGLKGRAPPPDGLQLWAVATPQDGGGVGGCP